MKITNLVRIKGIGPQGEPRELVKHNALTYAAADVMIAALIQSRPARVTHLYALYGNVYGTNGSGLPALPGDLRTATRDSFVTADDGGTYGGLWVPLVAAPSVSATDASLYSGNACTYFFRIPGALPANQFTGNYSPGYSYICAIGLACAQNANDRTQDQIMSAMTVYGTSAFTIASNAQETVEYPFQITF